MRHDRHTPDTPDVPGIVPAGAAGASGVRAWAARPAVPHDIPPRQLARDVPELPPELQEELGRLIHTG